MNSPDFAATRALINSVAGAASRERPCPECQQPCVPSRGRLSGKWMWYHLNASDCIYDQIGCRVPHDTEQAAMEGEMFK